MVSLSAELDHLRQADVHIADAVHRIALQQSLIASMPAGSAQRARAETLLLTMQTTLTQFTVHRAAIVESIARLREQGTDEAR
ncbi:hypothetical protein AWB76_04957 [Caballeronia temeraria]|uniref:Uncharacterized protein n=1 Tax=Caballeronia temeraria TaxID=1777137 RepID=A0A158C062_9BURK|nr:hypothetical protein [Caballeronia temeraria]SAK75745.1 hypothetical protein AWB76_04957 [Caballeronia temeraria]